VGPQFRSQPQLHISQYASSHPWEDFAETAAFYLDMRSVLDTLECHFEHFPNGFSSDNSLAEMLSVYQQAGMALNEVNRALGLTDLLPEVVSPSIVNKLQFVHRLLAKPA
jgi:hypothetical protein